MARIELAWELGGGTGHFSQLLPIGLALQSRGHAVRMLLREHDVGLDLPRAREVAREGAPIWVGPTHFENPVNFGEILINFGYADRVQLGQLVAAWRERLAGADLVVSNVAPAALIAARALGIESLEVSQGFHIPPPVFPSPAFRDWEPPPLAKMESADRQVLGAINAVLQTHGCPALATLGELFLGRSLVLTYPELDIYAGRTGIDYMGVVPTGEEGSIPVWPPGSGPRVFAYLYHYYPGLSNLLKALADLDVPTLAFCRGIDAALTREVTGAPIRFPEAPMSVSKMLPQSDLVICHGSHQMTAQALLGAKPLLVLPTHVEQMLIARRVERIGAGLGIAPASDKTDFSLPLAFVTEDHRYAENAAKFAARYGASAGVHVVEAIADRCEARMRAG